MRTVPWPRRVDVALLCFLANVIAHCDRVSISAAVPAMMAEYGWNTAQTGFLLSAFFAGYTLAMIPAGLLADAFGPRRVFAACMTWWSLCTGATAFAASLTGLGAARFLLGVGESGTAPCINGTLVRWFPRGEYSRATSLCWSGGYAGPIIAFPLASLLLHHYGWRAIFLGFTLLGFLWLPFWLRYEEPPVDAATRGALPWRMLLTRPAVWAVALLHFSSNWILYVMITWLPAYLLNERKFSLSGMAFGASLPFLCAWIGTNLFAQAIDRAPWDRTLVRKLALLPYLLAALSLFAIPVAPGDGLTVLLLCSAMTFLTAATPVFSSASLDLAPEHAASLASMLNAFANLAGVTAPAAIGIIVEQLGWQAAFWLTAAVCCAGAAAYFLFGSAERVAHTPADLRT